VEFYVIALLLRKLRPPHDSHACIIFELCMRLDTLARPTFAQLHTCQFTLAGFSVNERTCTMRHSNVRSHANLTTIFLAPFLFRMRTCSNHFGQTR
jgi:hypothetical protein